MIIKGQSVSIYGNAIIDNSLLLYLDAGSLRSYPGTGTTWSTLTPYTMYSASLVNGPVYTNSNGGNIAFDGVNDYAVISPNQIWNFGTSSFSAGIWVKMTSGSALGPGGNILRHDNGISNGLWYIWASDLNNIRFDIYTSSRDSTLNVGRYTSTAVPPKLFNDGEWHYLVGVREYGVGVKIYYDGVVGQVTSGIELPNTDITAATDAYPAIARAGSFNGEYNPISASIVQIYNRALSASEVLQNYNALKVRFGII